MNVIEELLLALAFGAALCLGGYMQGKADGRTDCLKAQVKAQQIAQVAVNKETARRDALGEQRVVTQEHIRVVYRTIREKADENVKNNLAVNDCGLDADGLRIWNAANSGEAAPMPGKPDYGLSGASSGQIGKIERLVLQPYRVDGAVRTVPRPTEEAGGVRR